MKNTIFLLLSLFLLPAAHAANWYVDPTIGGPRYSTQNPAYLTAASCSGQGTTPYNSSGSPNQACPFSDFRYLWSDPWTYNNTAWVIAGGDVATVSDNFTSAAPGRFSGADTGSVQGQFGWGIGTDFWMSPVPSGNNGAHTVIRGANYATCYKSVTNPAGGIDLVPDPAKTSYLVAGSLAGQQQPARGLSLEGSSYVDIQCLDLSSTSTSQYAVYGIWTGNTSNPTNGPNLLQDLNVHFFLSRGIIGSIGGGWTATRVEIAQNGQAGWDLDPGASQPSTGTLTMSYVGIDFNGCFGLSSGSCHDQNSGGYGDGIGTPVMPGLTVIMDHSHATYNTQDGTDWGHMIGGSVTVTNGYFFGNMGGNIKVGPVGSVFVYNNLINSNCERMIDPISGVPSGYNSNLSLWCRAGGDANGWNALSTSIILDGNRDISATGTTVTGIGSHFLTDLTVGSTIVPDTAGPSYHRVVTAIASDTSLTVASAFPANVPATYWEKLPSGSATSATNVKFYHNTFVGYGGTVMDNQCMSGIGSGGLGTTQFVVAGDQCSGYTFDFRDNTTLGYTTPDIHNGLQMAMWYDLVPTTGDYNVYSGLNTSPCVGVHDVCTSSLIFVSQPSTPVTVQSTLDNFNFNLPSASPARTAGTAIAGQVSDFVGRTWVSASGGLEYVTAPTYHKMIGSFKGSGSWK